MDNQASQLTQGLDNVYAPNNTTTKSTEVKDIKIVTGDYRDWRSKVKHFQGGCTADYLRCEDKTYLMTTWTGIG